MGLSQIRLELARTKDFPDGSQRHGYEFIAPLTTDSHIDAKAWKDFKDRCDVTRFWGDEEAAQGKLRHVGQGWRFDYDANEDADDEPLFKLDKHALTPGSYVSITEQDGEQYAFKVVSVTPLRA